jgi:hypothetical protein
MMQIFMGGAALQRCMKSGKLTAALAAEEKQIWPGLKPPELNRLQLQG